MLDTFSVSARIGLVPFDRVTLMLKPVMQLAAVGLVGIVVWKLAAAFLLPLVFLVVKIGLVVALIMAAFWFFNKKDRGKEDTPPASS